MITSCGSLTADEKGAECDKLCRLICLKRKVVLGGNACTGIVDLVRLPGMDKERTGCLMLA